MKLKSTLRFSLPFPLAAAIVAMLVAPSAQATTYYWDTNAAAGFGAVGPFTWDGVNNFWNTSSTGATSGTFIASPTNADDLLINGGTTGTITLSGAQVASSLTFATSVAKTLTGGTSLTIGGTGTRSGIFVNAGDNSTNIISSPLILNSTSTVVDVTHAGGFGGDLTLGAVTGSAASGTQTINVTMPLQAYNTTFGIIGNGGAGGVVGLTINGLAGNTYPYSTTSGVLNAGTVTLSAANTYTGATNVVAGNLRIDNVSTFTNTSAISLGQAARLDVNAANASLAELATAGGGSGVVAGSILRYSLAQSAAGAGNGPGTIFGTVELNLTNVNPNYTLDFGSGAALTNLVASTYTSALTLSGNASIDSSAAVATYTTGGITASSAGVKTLNLTGSNTGANTISSAIGNGSGTVGITKGGAGTWLLSGANTNTGATRIDAGILQFANTASLYNSTSGSWTAANIRVGNGGTLALNVGGTNQFTTGDITTLLGNLGGANGSSTTGFAAESAIGFDTTTASGSTFIVADVVANSTGTGGGAIGLTKLGTNTLVLSSDNTYTGRTTISGGTLQLGNGGTTGRLSTSSAILNNGNLTINRSDAVAQGTDFSAAPITGTGSFTKTGAGTTTLSAANTFSGLTTVSAGVLNLTNALALQNSAIVTTGAGTVTFTGFTTPVLGGLSGASGDLTTVIPGFASTTALSLNAASGSVTYGGVIGDGLGGGDMTLTKNGAGTQILSGANTYTGATIVNAGTLTVGSGATGSLNSASTLQMGGGIFNYSRTGASQTVNGLTVNAANSTVNNTSSGTILTLGAITRTPSLYGTINFATLTGAIRTTTGNTNSIVGPWATTGSTTTLRYAVGSADGITSTGIEARTGTTATSTTLANVTDATGNFEYSAAATTASDLTANTLRYSGAATTTAIGALNTLTLNGLMNAGTAALTVSGGPSTGGILIGSTNELVVAANAQNTTISAVIKDGVSAGTLVYSGGGTLTLSGANTYTGGLIINSGTVSTPTASSVSAGGTGTGPITVNGAGRLTLTTGVGTLNRALTLNGGTLFCNGSGDNLTVAGTIAFGANSTIAAAASNSGFPTVSANTSGTGGFTKTSTGGLRLNGTNTYSGPTVVSAGGLTVKSSLYGNDTSKWTPANITVAGGATLVLNVQGSGEFTIAQAATMFSQLSTNVNNNGLQAGSFIGVDTRNAAAGTYTYSANITDSTGPGGGAVSFKHTGTANTILELTGTNTYSGMSIVDNGSFLKVSSINSVFTNAALGTVHSASSSLGAPTTVANGTIHLGTGGSTAQSGIGNTFQAGGLIYTGTGETTDRIISMNDGGSITSTIDQSGTGHLKFLSSFTSLDQRGNKTLLLRGSTTGTGEIAGVIPNANSGATLLTKTGTGTWTLSGANTYAGTTTISGGALVLANANALKGGIGSTGGLGALTFNGGVIGLGAGDFSRPLAAANTIGAATFSGTGGWAAYGADRLVNLGGASATITWATASTGLNGQTLILGNATATHMVNFQNPLDMGNTTRTVQVDDGTAAIDGKLSGALTGTGGNLSKTGLGTLELSGTNSYTGTTSVSAGTLLVNGTNSGTGSVTVASGATLGGTGSIAGAATFSSGGKALFTVTQANTTPLTIAGVMTFTDATEVRLNLPANLPAGTYTLATSSATPTGTVTATPVVVSGSYAAGVTSAVVSLNTADKKLLLTVTGSPYDTWANGTYSPALTAKLSGDNQDGDSLTNLQEFAFGTQPTVSTGEIAYSAGTLTTPGAPKVVAASGNYSMVFGRRADYVAAGLTYTVQFSTALEAWVDNDDVANAPVQVATDGTINAMSVPYPNTINTPNGPRKPTFSRVKVVLAP